MFTLSKRLQTIASMIPQCVALCDVGCDHGYLPIEAVNRGICDHAYALDVRKGPLERAKINVSEAGMSERIILKLSDGLEKMQPGEADVIVIAGMGGPLMEDILTRGEKAARAAKCLVLSPQSHLCDFRGFLCRTGYHITDEKIVYDDGKYYFIMRVEFSDGDPMVLSDFEMRYGTVDDGPLEEYLAAEKNRLLNIRENLLLNSPGDAKLSEISKEIDIIDNYCKDTPFS